MKTAVFQELITITQGLLAGGTAGGTYTMPADDIGDLRGLQTVILGIELLSAIATTGGTPILFIDTSDDVGSNTWRPVWSSRGVACAQSTLTISSELDPSEPYYMGRFIRWRVVITPPTAGATKTITFRITLNGH